MRCVVTAYAVLWPSRDWKDEYDFGFGSSAVRVRGTSPISPAFSDTLC